MSKESPTQRAAASDGLAEPVHNSSGNVFADINLPDTDRPSVRVLAGV